MFIGTGEKSRLEVFRSHNAHLDQIQKDLEDYLETKRYVNIYTCYCCYISLYIYYYTLIIYTPMYVIM